MTAIDEYVAANGTRLLRTAWLLTGDHLAAEDLVRTALLKVWSRWPRILQQGSPEEHLRRAMLAGYLSPLSYLGWRSASPHHLERSGESSALYPHLVHPMTRTTDLREVLLGALAGLPRRQRATLVLRYYQDLSEAQTAAALGCSLSTVKSRTAKALRSMHARLGDVEVDSHGD